MKIPAFLIKNSNFKTILLIVLFGTINSSLFAQATCTLPVTGPFFENNGGGILSIGQMKTQGLCYTMPAGAVGTFKTVCYRYTYPLSGTIAMNYGIEYSCGSSCSAGYQTSYNGACLGSPDCNVGGAGPVITTYDASCGFVMNGGGIGTGCGAGAFVPGQDYIMCFKVPLDPSCTVTVCPVIACSSGNCGCPSSITATVSANQILCGVTTTTITGNNAAPGTGTWTRISGPNTPSITSPNSASTTVTGMITGTYVFRWSVSCASANGTADITVTVNPNLVPAISSNTPVTCTGSANGILTVTSTGGAAPYTYAWTPSGGTGSTASNLSGGTYTVTVVGGGCTKTVSATVAQSGTLLTPTISSITPVGCTGGSTGSLTASQTGGTGSFTYLWSPGGATTSTISGLSANTYTVTITDAYGCIKTTSGIVTQPVSAIGSTISSQNNVNCKGDATGSATVTGTGGTPNYTYSWSPGSKTTAAVTGLTSGTYSVTVTDANGCTKVQSVIITQPISSVSSTTSSINATCGNSNGTASVTASGGTPGFTYSWSPAGGTGSTASNLPAGPYTVTITDSKGCTKADAVSVNNSGAPTVTISSQVNVLCNGAGTGTATATATGGTGTLTYLWTPGGQTTTSVTGLTSGTYVVTVTDSNSCAQGKTINITQPTTAVNIGISSQSNVGCTGFSSGSATITATGGTGTLTYLWSPGGQTTNTISGLPKGTYSVTVTDANGCSQQQIVNITQPTTSLSITPGSTNASCGSSDGTVSVTASGGTPLYTYNWNNGATDALISGLIAGTYSVIVTDNNGCSQTTSVTISGLPGPSITGTPSSNITCNGLTNGTITVNASSGTLPYTYIWTPSVTTNNVANNLSATTYTVVVSDAAGCKDTAVILIKEPLAMTFSLTTSNATVCAGEPLTLLTSTPVGGTAPFTFTWLPTGPLVNPLIPTTYSVTVTDAGGCVSPMDTIRVIPLAKPTAGFDAIPSGLLNDKYTFKDSSIGADSWYWNFGDGTTSTGKNPYHTYLGAGTYTVTQVVINSVTGCTDTITKIIVILPKIIIPNVFTPNHDGINDDFWIPNTGFESFELTIYDRWGLKLFTTNEGQIRWDGRTSAANEVPDGTYYFILKAILKDQAGGKNYDANGYISLLRGSGK